MMIIISPAKKMNADTDSFACAGLPQFLPEAEALMARLRAMSGEQLRTLWRCNPSIAALNAERLRHMDLRKNLTPALFSYEGIQYQYMAPGVFEDGQLRYIGEHLRILSGFYGLLRPFDGVTPYRLEMQARLSVGGSRDLYAYWGDKLSRQLYAQSDVILNLASREYSRAVSAYLSKGVRFLTCTFGERVSGGIVEKGTLCKMARGRMARFLAENAVTTPEAVKEFDGLGYAFAREYSTENHFVFVKRQASI